MDISELDRNETLELLEADSAFLSQLNLIDYSLLVLKIRKLGEDETDDDKADAL